MQKLPFFWRNAKATIVSPLSPSEACERLQGTLPRFQIQSEAGVVLLRPRYYSGTLKGNSFCLQGPLGPHVNQMVEVRGTIESDGRNSRIELTLSPGGALAIAFFGFLAGVVAAGICVVLDRAISMGALALTLPLWVLTAVGYVAAMAGNRRYVKRLLIYLQTLFEGEIRHGP